MPLAMEKSLELSPPHYQSRASNIHKQISIQNKQKNKVLIKYKRYMSISNHQTWTTNINNLVLDERHIYKYGIESKIRNSGKNS
jgi:3-hydroxy-3-methylglutaryl CoA synthase